MRLPSLKLLKSFQIAAKLGSFKAAAEELCVTTSAIGHQVRMLEEQLGVVLFERTARGLGLTGAGQEYFVQIDAILKKLELFTTRAQGRFNRAVIRLHVPPFFANELLLPQLSVFTQVGEGTDIRIETRVATPKTHAPEADLSVVVGEGPWERCTAHRLFAQVFSAACSPEFALTHPIKSFAELNGKTLLVHAGRRDAWDRFANSLGVPAIRPNHLVCLGNMADVVLAAEQGGGAALVPSRLTADRFRAGDLVKLFNADWVTNESYVLLQRPEDGARLELRELTEWILRSCRAELTWLFGRKRREGDVSSRGVVSQSL